MTRNWCLSCRILSEEAICSDLHFQKKGRYWAVNKSSSGGAQEDGIDVRNAFTMKKIGFLGFSELMNVGRRGHKE